MGAIGRMVGKETRLASWFGESPHVYLQQLRLEDDYSQVRAGEVSLVRTHDLFGTWQGFTGINLMCPAQRANSEASAPDSV